MMMGSGARTDPYIVDNWFSFMTIDTTDPNIYVKWLDSAKPIIDFNDINPEGFSSTIKFPANVNFNGWTLRNFHSTASDAIGYNASPGKIKNLILENFYVTSETLFYGTYMLENCVISGLLQAGGNNVYVFYGAGLERCSLNIKATARMFNLASGSSFLSPKTQIINSDVILNISCSNVTTICDNMIKNSRISGKIQTPASSIMLGNFYSSSNVFNIESNCSLKYTGNGVSVFNSDIATKSDDSNKNFVGCTAEQLKNSGYLYSLGFPIGVD